MDPYALICPKCKASARPMLDMTRGWYVQCTKCGHRGNAYSTVSNARKAWPKEERK